MSAQRFNPYRVKLHRSYSVRQLAALFDIHKNTVGNWQGKGLRPIDSGRPIVFVGAAVRDFLIERNAERKRPCPPGTLYCFRCRVPQSPALGLIEYVPITSNSGNVRGLCAACETIMHRRVKRSELGKKMPNLEVQFSEASLRLIGKPSSSLNCDSGTKAAA